MIDDKEVYGKLSSDSGIKVDESIFNSKDENEQSNSTEDDEINDKNTENSVVDDFNRDTFEEEMMELGLTKESIKEMIYDLADKGFIEESFSLFDGRLKFRFKTAKMEDSRAFVEAFDSMQINTQIKSEYYINLFALGSILSEFNGSELSDKDILSRMNWIQSNLSTTIYKILLEKANMFIRKVELLSSEQVADFF